MFTSTSLRARIASVLATVAVAFAGTLVATSAPAQAAISETNYGFQTFAFGTRALSKDLGVNSGRTAYSYILCTRMAGLDRTNRASAGDAVAAVNLPSDESPLLHVAGVDSSSSTFKADGIRGTQSVNSIAEVVLGELNGPHLVIKNLTTTAKAWADKSGKLHAVSSVSSVDIEAETGVAEVDAVLGQAGAGIRDLMGLIQDNGGVYEIPGIGRIHLGASTPLDRDVHERFARATATILRVELDQTNTVVTVGRSYARINKDMPAGVMHGSAYGADIPEGLGGALKVGRLGNRVLPCEGTQGKEITTNLLGVGIQATDQLAFGQLKGIVMGLQATDGTAVAQTTGKLSTLKFGPLYLESIVARATVTQKKSGAIKKSIDGSSIGRLVVDGQEFPAPQQGDVLELPGGLGRVTFFATEKTKRKIFVTAARIELLKDFQGAAAGTVIRVGNARASIVRY